jgi:hypothetical protein
MDYFEKRLNGSGLLGRYLATRAKLREISKQHGQPGGLSGTMTRSRVLEGAGVVPVR